MTDNNQTPDDEINPRSMRSKYKGTLIHVRGIAPGKCIVGAFALTHIEQTNAISDAMHEAYQKKDFNAFGMPNVQNIAPLIFAAESASHNFAPAIIDRVRFISPAGETIIDYDHETLIEMQGLSDAEAEAIIAPLFEAAFPGFDDVTECLNRTGAQALQALSTTCAMQDSMFALGAMKLDAEGNFVLNEHGYPAVDDAMVKAGAEALQAKAYEANEMADANTPEIPR